jgi:hypothetical protein
MATWWPLTDEERDQLLLLHSVISYECRHGVSALDGLEVAHRFYGPTTERELFLTLWGTLVILSTKNAIGGYDWRVRLTGDPFTDERNYELGWHCCLHGEYDLFESHGYGTITPTVTYIN